MFRLLRFRKSWMKQNKYISRIKYSLQLFGSLKLDLLVIGMQMGPVIIIQARMGSTRLPGKILKPVCGEINMLEAVIQRLRKCTYGFHLVVATTECERDRVIVDFCQKNDISCVCGSEDDVLSRYYLAAMEYHADSVLRITSDCPLIDPQVVDSVYEFFLSGDYDYVSNILERTYPRGLDVEVFKFSVLEKIHLLATELHEREHVTSYIYTHPHEFQIGSFKGPIDYSQYRLTVDTPKDLELVQNVYRECHHKIDVTLDEIIQILEEHPSWISENSHIVQKYDSQTAYLSSV